MTEPADMTTIEGLTAGLGQTHGVHGSRTLLSGTPNGTHCPQCGDVRRMRVEAMHRSSPPTPTMASAEALLRSKNDMSDPENLPSIFGLTCVQCSEKILVVAYVGPNGPEVVALPSTYGGLSTPNSPDTVTYYLDQAERSYAVGAHSATMTMYRSALEQILLEQGYDARMLGPKIAQLEEDLDPPRWYRDLEPEFLDIIRKLGNLATHASERGVDEQRALERELMGEVRALFVELLDDIYEQPARRSERLRKLRQAAEGE